MQHHQKYLITKQYTNAIVLYYQVVIVDIYQYTLNNISISYLFLYSSNRKVSLNCTFGYYTIG